MLSNTVDQFAGGMLLHIAFLTVAIAFLVRDVLWLRALSIVAYSLFMAVAAVARPEAPWSLLAWYGGFIGINLVHAVWLVCERQMCRLTSDERRLLELAFPALDQLTLKRLLRQGEWCTFEPETRLTAQNAHPTHLYVIFEGRVDVYINGRSVATIGPGHFVGEIAFISNAPASADTFAGTAMRAFCWNQEALRRVCARQPGLREAMYSAIGPDLARKVNFTSARLSGPEAPEQLVTAPGADPMASKATGS
jgi:CRP-like cAMP-binding protein